MGGEGATPLRQVFPYLATSLRPSLLFPKPFRCNTYGPPRKCCKQKTYGQAKLFRCNTYTKQGERAGVSLRSSTLVLRVRRNDSPRRERRFPLFVLRSSRIAGRGTRRFSFTSHFPNALPSSFCRNPFISHPCATFPPQTVLRDENRWVCTSNSHSETRRTNPEATSHVVPLAQLSIEDSRSALSSFTP